MIEAIIAIVSLAIGGGGAWIIASKNTSTKAIEIDPDIPYAYSKRG